MAARPTDRILDWASGGSTTDPGGSKEAAGWLVSERPPANWWNWILNSFGQWLGYLDTNYAGETVSIPYRLADWVNDPSDGYTGANPASGWGISVDGFQLYLINTSEFIYQYTMSDAFTLGSAGASVGNFDLNLTGPCYDMDWSPDGTKLYVLAASTTLRSVYQFSTTTAWDVTDLSYDSKLLSVESEESLTDFFTISSTGTKVYVGGHDHPSTIHQYTLGTAWDMSTGSYDSISLDVETQAPARVTGLQMSPDGTSLFVAGSDEGIYEFSLPTPYVLTSATVESVSADYGDIGINGYGMKFSSTGNTLLMGNGNDLFRTFANKLVRKG